MIIYLSFILIAIVFFILSYNRCHVKINGINKSYKEPNLVLFMIAFASLLTLYSCRGWTGTDTGLYNYYYRSMWKWSLKDVFNDNRDWLFYSIQWINYRIARGSLIFNNFIIGLLVYIPVLIIYKKYSRSFMLSLTFYILTGGFFYAFNGQRQAVAMSFVLIAIILLIKKEYVICFAVLLLAYQFHSTVMFMIPIMFLINQKTDSKVFLITCSVILVSSLFLWSLWNTMFELLGVLGQDKIVNDYSFLNAETASGANFIRVLVLGAPALLGGMFYKKLQKKNEYFYIWLNCSILAVLFMFAGTKTWYFARVAAYFELANPIVLVEVINGFNKRSQKIYIGAAIGLYAIYCYLYLHMDSNLLPYNFNFIRSFY